MFFKKLLICAICLTIILSLVHTNCLPLENDNKILSNTFAETSSITSDAKDKISEEIVTIINNSSVLDKLQTSREFPTSASHKKSLDNILEENDYNDGGGNVNLINSQDEPSECILSRSELYLSWWVNENGSLKLPASNRQTSSGFADLSFRFEGDEGFFKHVSEMTSRNPNDVIKFMSMANNELSKLPIETLNLVSIALQYLSLANNNFNDLFVDHNLTFQSWTAFPLMANLKELDLRNCSLTNLEYDIFKSLGSLEKLFLSHNVLSTISSTTFSNLHHLTHLDLSYNTLENIVPYIVDPFAIYFNGLVLEEDVFANLPNLIFLDLSHSKLKQESVRALSQLQGKVEQLSLCYTEIPLIAPDMFNETNLKVLDLSGNPNLIPNLVAAWFGGLELKLEILIFQDSNIKNLNPFRNLAKLKMLDLENNNINKISLSNFEHFDDLEILDLEGNHISNWYERVFETNSRLRVVNLRNNNINLITPNMMADFSETKYLAVGANSFHCHCSLREFIDRAAFNAMLHQCELRNRKRRMKRSDLPEEFNDPKYYYNVLLREFHYYVQYVEESYKNILGEGNSEDVSKESRQSFYGTSPQKTNCNNLTTETDGLSTAMTFDFLLLDYSENDYHCVESEGLTKSKRYFSELTPCDKYSQSTDKTEPGNENDNKDNEVYDGPESPKSLLIVYITVGTLVTSFFGLWIWKRRDIRYFCSIFRNTLILSFDKEDKKSLMLKNRKTPNNNDDQYRFDLFVSYCEKDRSFILNQLVPNLEKRSEITICLHERDFQVGVSILENIIQCMDQSRCLLLVVSESFIKSNWCSFEMHLAQHRLIETRREQLILVLLQDIPKSKRPRTLTYLMRTKTYIMWPNEDKDDLRNSFWKRLKKAIVLNNWEPERAQRKPRHSIV